RSYNNPQDLATVDVYDPVADSWTTASSLLTARGGAAAVGLDTGSPCGGSLYVFGGGWDTPLARTERYDITARNSSQSTPPRRPPGAACRRARRITATCC